MNKGKMMGRLFIFLCFFLSLGFLYCQETETTPSYIELDRWDTELVETEVIKYKGKTALQIKEAPGERITYLKDYTFENGIIELDIAAIPFYTGLVFRVRSESVYEGIYFRPQNSRHEDPKRRGHTIQYIGSPMYTWFYLRDKSPEKYESGVDVAPQEWFHVKVVVTGIKAEVYVNRAESPSLVVDDLKHGVSKGSVGLWCGNRSGGTFANLSVKHTAPTQEGVGQDQTAKVTSPATYTPEQEYLFEIFNKRRSIRKFKSTPIPQEHIEKILDIARTAPTSGNQQPWKFLVVQDQEKIDRLLGECVASALERAKKREGFDPSKEESLRNQYRERIGNYLSAPVYVVVLVDKNSRYPSYNIYDGSLAAGYLMVAARALGYGTVFITDALPVDLVKKVFAIPDNFVRICITPIGIPESWPDPPDKKPLHEFAVYEQLIEGVNYTIPIKRKPIELDPIVLDMYVGKYQLNEEVDVTVTQEEGQLYLQASGQNKIAIFPEAEDKFFMKVADVQVTFVREGGIITELIVHQGGRDLHAKRID
ncbi:nitroreductase family protein [Acidobacteriota bacterium]